MSEYIALTGAEMTKLTPDQQKKVLEYAKELASKPKVSSISPISSVQDGVLDALESEGQLTLGKVNGNSHAVRQHAQTQLGLLIQQLITTNFKQDGACYYRGVVLKTSDSRRYLDVSEGQFSSLKDRAKTLLGIFEKGRANTYAIIAPKGTVPCTDEDNAILTRIEELIAVI